MAKLTGTRHASSRVAGTVLSKRRLMRCPPIQDEGSLAVLRSTNERSITPDWPRIAPAIYYLDAAKAIDWLCRAFGFKVRLKVEGEGGRIEHSELVYGEGLVMVGEAERQEKALIAAPPADADAEHPPDWLRNQRRPARQTGRGAEWVDAGGRSPCPAPARRGPRQ
jgi:hypothetical protein